MAASTTVRMGSQYPPATTLTYVPENADTMPTYLGRIVDSSFNVPIRRAKFAAYTLSGLLAATAGLAEDTTGVLALAARLELPRIDPALLEPGNPRLGAAVADHVRSARSVARQSAVLVAASLETDLLGPQGPTARGREP